MANREKEDLILEINTTDKNLLNRVLEACNSTLNGDSILHDKPSRLGDDDNHVLFISSILPEYDHVDEIKLRDILSSSHTKLEKEWERLIRSAIAALRKNDLREPFQEPSHIDKNPSAYGVTDLKNFFKKFIDFEDVLYGADRWYRDHVVHAYRVWLLGVDFLLRSDTDGTTIIDKFARNLTSDVQQDLQQNCIKASLSKFDQGLEAPICTPYFLYSRNEVLSIWTIAALTHDLGYPLEKAPKVLRYIQDMMSNFVSSPEMQHNLNFNTAADTVNDYIVKLISTRMVQCRQFYGNSEEKVYAGRVQPKFYIKFLKSLEACRHGVISSIVLYKSLLFFLESDCNIHEDYRFTSEEVRQFYARREILRSIATHTCTDVYQMFVPNFSFLLFFCDELQDWGRNKFHGIKDDDIYFYPPTVVKFSSENIEIHQKYLIRNFDMSNTNVGESTLAHATQRIEKEFQKFRQVYRDGIDTKKRKFSYIKKVNLVFPELEKPITITYRIPHDSEASICFSINGLTPHEIAKYSEAITSKGVKPCSN